MDAAKSSFVIHIQLVMSNENTSINLPIQGSIPFPENHLISDLLSKLQAVYKNQAGDISSGLNEKLDSTFPHSNLTCREKEVVKLLGKGKSHKQIAAELNIACSTVGKHLQNIYEKLGVSCKYEVFQKLVQQTQPS